MNEWLQPKRLGSATLISVLWSQNYLFSAPAPLFFKYCTYFSSGYISSPTDKFWLRFRILEIISAPLASSDNAKLQG